jgi:hypothetical protein
MKQVAGEDKETSFNSQEKYIYPAAYLKRKPQYNTVIKLKESIIDITSAPFFITPYQEKLLQYKSIAADDIKRGITPDVF